MRERRPIRRVARMLTRASIALAAILLAATLPMLPASAQTTSAAAGANQLDIQVVGLRSNSGEVGCSIFSDHKAYPSDDSKVLKHVWAPIHDNKADCIFKDLAPGQYAAVVFHDENGNHKFDENAFGMPKEGYGFSNDAPATFSAPKFDAAAFNYPGKSQTVVIHIRYWP
jgi:uncharacterized protein (DUF2141 family)